MPNTAGVTSDGERYVWSHAEANKLLAVGDSITKEYEVDAEWGVLIDTQDPRSLTNFESRLHDIYREALSPDQADERYLYNIYHETLSSEERLQLPYENWLFNKYCETLPPDAREMIQHVEFYKNTHKWTENLIEYARPRVYPEPNQTFIEHLKAAHLSNPNGTIPSLAEVKDAVPGLDELFSELSRLELGEINIDELSIIDETGALVEPIPDGPEILESEFPQTTDAANYGWIAGLVIGCVLAVLGVLHLCWLKEWLCWSNRSGNRASKQCPETVRRRLQKRPVFQIWEEPTRPIDGLLSENDREAPHSETDELSNVNDYSDGMITAALSMMLSAATLALIYFVYRSVKAFTRGKTPAQKSTGRQIRV